ncbi:MAG TPA: helix-turn-helix transcriptional regulator [Solirubrobacteraceae bacterium]|nr:helix-turn-helix transcriptional regulator [Solirubrobacteraceae bacterium]
MARNPGEPDKALGAVIRRAREAKGDSQEALAFHAGITTGTLQRLELGHSDPAWSTVRAVARALDLSLRELAAAVESAREGS